MALEEVTIRGDVSRDRREYDELSSAVNALAAVYKLGSTGTESPIAKISGNHKIDIDRTDDCTRIETIRLREGQEGKLAELVSVDWTKGTVGLKHGGYKFTIDSSYYNDRHHQNPPENSKIHKEGIEVRYNVALDGTEYDELSKGMDLLLASCDFAVSHSEIVVAHLENDETGTYIAIRPRDPEGHHARIASLTHKSGKKAKPVMVLNSDMQEESILDLKIGDHRFKIYEKSE